MEVPEEECYRVEKAHEPTIDREVWEIVQRVRANKRRPWQYPLSVLVWCVGTGEIHLCLRDIPQAQERIHPTHGQGAVLAGSRFTSHSTVCAAAQNVREAFIAHLTAKQSGQVK